MLQQFDLDMYSFNSWICCNILINPRNSCISISYQVHFRFGCFHFRFPELCYRRTVIFNCGDAGKIMIIQ